MMCMDETEFIAFVKEKEELKGAPDALVRQTFTDVLGSKVKITELSPRECKLLQKEVRSNLRKQFGMYQLRMKERSSSSEVLHTHLSTAERVDFYPFLKEKMKQLKIHSILDIGCGLNPLALAEKSMKYHALDIDETSLNTVSSFFKKNHIQGTISVCDIRKEFPSISPIDLAILFKVLDLVDKKGHKRAEELLKEIHAKHLWISFPTKTLSGRPMNHPQRGWIERLLTRLKYPFTLVNFKNEIIYLAEKTS